MKSKYHRLLLTTASVALTIGTASAANKYWSGTGNWTDSTWGTTSGGPYTTTWAGYDVAVFEGSVGTVTIAGTQYANRVYFNTDGYIVTGGILAFGDPGDFSLNAAAGVTATIQSDISHPYGTGLRKYGTGTIKLTGSTIANSGLLVISGGALSHEGSGTWSQNNDSYLGNGAGTGLSKLNLSEGTFTLAAGKGMYVGVRDSAELNISGSGTTVTVGSISTLWQGDATAGCTATLNLNGGTLTANSISRNNTNRAFTANLNGGLFKAGAAGTLLNANLSRVNVRDGGAKIEVNGTTTSTIAADLQHSNVSGDNATDGGLTKTGDGTLTLTGANTYTGNTTINAGTLTLSGSGSITASPIIEVAAIATLQGGSFGSGQTVQGSGTLDGTVAINSGATLSPAGAAAVGSLAADFSVTPQTASTSVDLDGNRTVGSLKFSITDPDTWSLTSTGNYTLTLAAASSSPTIEVAEGTTTVSAILAGSQGLAA